MEIHKASKSFAIAILVTFCMIGGNFVNGEKSVVSYGDQVFLQNYNLDSRWLTGGRNSGNEGVLTRNIYSSDYEIGQAETSYKWTVRSTRGEGSRNYPEPKQGECLKYGDQIFLQVNNLDDRWLSGGRNSGNEGALTRNIFKSDYEIGQAETSYKWTVRSTFGTGTRTNNNNQDPGHGACIEELSVIFLQANNLDDRWLSGGRNSGNEGVLTRNEQLEGGGPSYQWIVRKSSGTGSRSDALQWVPVPADDCTQEDKVYCRRLYDIGLETCAMHGDFGPGAGTACRAGVSISWKICRRDRGCKAF
jgi:hypothetical protein